MMITLEKPQLASALKGISADTEDIEKLALCKREEHDM